MNGLTFSDMELVAIREGLLRTGFAANDALVQKVQRELDLRIAAQGLTR